MLDHGERTGAEVPGATFKQVNVAQDITINEMIVSVFGYDREDLENWKKYCWIDTCFDEPQKVLHNETFTYYLQLLVKQNKDALPETLDQHGTGDSGGDGEKKEGEGDQQEMSPEEKEARKEIAGKLAEELTNDEIEKLVKGLPDGSTAGTISGSVQIMIEKRVKKTKFRFANLLKKLKRSRHKLIDIEIDTFVKDARRFSSINADGDVSLPGKNDAIKTNKDKLYVLVFMDVSMSCMPYLNIFQKVFLTFEAEREIFETRLFAFDTHVREVRPGQSITAGGGTNFGIVEAEVLRVMKENGNKYPDCVVVITDGDGTHVRPKMPQRWFWLLTPNAPQTYINQASMRHYIKDVIL